MAFLALRSPLPGRKAEFAGEIELIGMRVFLPASLVLVVLGFYLVSKGDWGYPLWVIFGLAGFGFSFVTGLAYLTPQSKRIKQLLEIERQNRQRRSSESARRCSPRGSSS
jgi:hypothetical protein